MPRNATTDNALDRRSVVADLLAGRGELLVVCGLGGTTWDVMSAGDNALNFYSWGGMGSAAMTGLGLALAQPRRKVLVVTGDGEMLMGMGSLATIAAQAPANLAVAVIDNELYGETGRQPTHTALGADLAVIAKGCGIARAETITDAAGVAAFRARVHGQPGPHFAAIKVGRAEHAMVLPERDGPAIKTRFRRALLG